MTMPPGLMRGKHQALTKRSIPLISASSITPVVRATESASVQQQQWLPQRIGVLERMMNTIKSVKGLAHQQLLERKLKR